MARAKPALAPPEARSGRIGLAVMRLQPLHKGHTLLLKHMIEDCDVSIIAFGSTQLSRTVGNPFTFEQRLDMVRSVFGDLFKPVPLIDLDSLDTTDDWVNYVLDKIRKTHLPAPTDLYCGSVADAKWYMARFARLSDPTDKVGPVTTYTAAEDGRRLHILDRDGNDYVSASELRSLIERRDLDWPRWVPRKLVPYIERHYPPRLRCALEATAFPEDVPEGTAVIRRDHTPPTRYVLQADQSWKAEREAREALFANRHDA